MPPAKKRPTERCRINESMRFGRFNGNYLSISLDQNTAYNRADVFLSGDRGGALAEMHLEELKELRDLIDRVVGLMERC